MFQFLRLSTKFLAVLRLSVNPIETLLFVLKLGGVYPEKPYRVLIKGIGSSKQNQSKTKSTLV